MDMKSLNRPPRPKRPAEVIRHVDETMDAYRIAHASRKDKAAEPAPPPARATDRG
jgi:hypothetical protein